MDDKYVVQDLQYAIADYLREEEASGDFKRKVFPELKAIAKQVGYLGFENLYEVLHEDGEMFEYIMDNYLGELYNKALQEAVLDFLNDSETIDYLGDGEIALKESTSRNARRHNNRIVR